MRSILLNAVALLAAVVLVIGCGEEKAAKIPSKLDQSLPTVAGTAGGGGDAGKAKVPAAAAKKAAPPNAKVD